MKSILNYDMHSLVTRHLYPEKTKGMTLEQIKEKLPELRKKVKAGVFAYLMDGNASHIAKGTGISKEEAEEIFNNCTKFLQ